MSKKTEARMTAEEGAQAAPVKDASKAPAPVIAAAASARHGMDEVPRDEGHSDEDRNDERDSQNVHEMSDAEFLAQFSSIQNQSVLPDLPKIPGYHTFWATTTNPRDSIPARLRLGYTFIKPEEIPGWDGTTIKTGDYGGCVGINEMVAMKIPERRYQLMMSMNHHTAPLAEEEKIRAMVQNTSENALRDKGRIEDEDGFADNIVQKAPAPKFH